VRALVPPRHLEDAHGLTDRRADRRKRASVAVGGYAWRPMTRRSRFALLWTVVACALAALAIPLTPPVYHLLVDLGWLDPSATTGGDPFGKVLRRLLLLPIAVIMVGVLRPWRDVNLTDMGLRGPCSRPRAGAFAFVTTIGVLVAVLAVHGACGWLVWEATDPAGRIGARVARALASALVVATLENWFFRAWLPVLTAGWFGKRFADPAAILLFASLHAFRAKNLDGPMRHDAGGAWEALKSWTSTLFDPVAFGPMWIGLVLFATLLTVAYRTTRTLWVPIGIHAAGIWVLLSYGAFSTRLDTPRWAGTKVLYDGIPGWLLLLAGIAWFARRTPAAAEVEVEGEGEVAPAMPACPAPP
jgi:hypothetical protein